MNSISLATSLWFRAQGFYILLHIVGVLIGSLWLAFGPGEMDGLGFLVFIALFSCGYALIVGLVGWVVLCCITHILAPLAARAKILLPFLLLIGLGATAATLWLTFKVLLSGIGHLDGLDTFFSVLACVSMLLGVFSLRKKIREQETGDEERLGAFDVMK